MSLAVLLTLATLAAGERDLQPLPDGSARLEDSGVTALVGLDDLDGDGCAELALARVGWRMCGMELLEGTLTLLSGARRPLGPAETLHEGAGALRARPGARAVAPRD